VKKWLCLLLLLSTLQGMATEKAKNFFWRGGFYQDWMGFLSDGEGLVNRVSSRLSLTLVSKPGDGWTVYFDARNRFATGEGVANRFLIYEARLAYDSLRSNFFLSLGQMNLYDTAGIGQLAGIMAGYKLGRTLSAGAYGGLVNDLYDGKLAFNYQKYGIFARYLGPGARQFSLSCNLVRFENQVERLFIYSSLLLPLGNFLIVYGNAEYELDGRTSAGDRLSRLFVNARANLTRFADVTASYSSGRGMDYHRFLLEQSQDPDPQNSEIERFFYNTSYGLRLTLTPVKQLRFHVFRQESEILDAGIRNHTTGFGFAANNVFRSGISLYGNYNLNRGDASEADTFYFSAARNFGKLAVNLSYANYFNGVRFSEAGTPQLIRIALPKQQTFSGDLFLALNRIVAVSLNYSYMLQADYSDQQLIARLILRK
jgi:hypothetical protein